MTTSLFDMFKIIFGIIASIMILIFVLRYAGDFKSFQETSQEIKIVDNFKKAAEDVYLTGDPQTFYDFSRIKSNLSFSGLEDPPKIYFKSGNTPIFTPILFSPSKELLITKAFLNYGWWDFATAVAVPQTVIIFTPLELGQENLDIMKSITDIFQSSIGYSPNISFGLCNGRDIEIFSDGFELTNSLSQQNRFEKCTARLQDGFKLVTISANCDAGFVTKGVCIRPSHTFIAGSQSQYVYKDPLDLAFLIIGNDKKDVFGVTEGEKLYKYKNKIYSQSLFIAAKIQAERLSLISFELEKIKTETEKLASELEETECRGIYNEISNQIYISLSYLTNNADSAKENTEEAKKLYDEIKSKNCIRLPSDIENKFTCAAFGFAEFRSVSEKISALAKQDYFDAVVADELKQNLELSKQLYQQYKNMGCD